METALYLPVKRFLEKLGFTVKGEIGGCDLVALSGDEPPIVVIGELKLVLQSRTGPAGGRSRRRRRRGLACGQNCRRAARAARATRAIAICAAGSASACWRSPAPATSRCWSSRRPRPAAQSQEALAPGRRTPAAQGRSGAGRQHSRADHDGLSPAGAGLRRSAVERTAAGARSQARVSRRRERSCCTTSMAGSIAPSAASTS